MLNPSKIALFGGSFDPVHAGHIAMAGRAREALDLDQVRFIPCQISPHKLETRPTAAVDRLEMLELATVGLDWAVVDDLETNQPGPSYSWQTAETMRSRFPGARLFWMMGTDQWDALPRWAHPERLAACVEFIVLTRGTPPEPRDGHRLHTVTFDHPASSTAIRQAIASGTQPPPWLHPDVAAWIEQNQLYRTSG